jgi:Tfp pilus assembly protein PilP
MAARSEATSGGLQGSGVLRIVGIVALVLIAVGIAGVRMGWIPFGAKDDAVLATSESTPASEGPATVNTSVPDDVSIDAASQDAGTGTPVKTVAPAKIPPPAPSSARSSTRAAASSGSSVSAVTTDRRTQLAQIDEHVTYQYNAIGRRDPFQSLLSGEFVGNDVGGDAPPDPGGMKIVGIVWGASDQFAMVEDVRGNSYVLRKGDKLQNGYVESLRRDAVVVNVTADGQSQQVVIPFVRKGDANAR